MIDLKLELKQQALNEGFDAVGICSPSAIPEANSRLHHFLSSKYHGTMVWMENRSEWRGNPTSLWPEARSVIMLADSYSQRANSLENLKHVDKGTIALYARNRDYHDLIKKRLKRIGRWLIQQQPQSEIKVFVDTAPVMEKPLGQAAGIGWQGKHTNLINRKIGNWFFLGAIFTTIELPPDEQESDHCGSCRRCLDICPTNAFPEPYQLDATKCISYLTIEHKGPVPENLRKSLGNRIFGCDDCLQICPWNKFAKLGKETRYHARKELESPSLKQLVNLDDRQFREMFRGGPITRIGRNRFVRNVLYAIGNSNLEEFLPAVQKLKTDPEPIVADAAYWAEKQLAGDD